MLMRVSVGCIACHKLRSIACGANATIAISWKVIIYSIIIIPSVYDDRLATSYLCHITGKHD